MSLRFVTIVVAVTVSYLSIGTRPALAADPAAVEVSGSYVVLPAIGYGNDYPTGWLVSVGVLLTNAVGVMGEVGGSYKTDDIGHGVPALRASMYNLMVGPKFVSHAPHIVAPFAQVLFGGIRVGNNYGGYVKYFAWQPGAGIDLRVMRALGLRLQADFRLIPIDGMNLKQFRFAAGVVVRL